MDLINFPPGIPEEDRIKICKMLESKDNELSSLYKEIINLENKLERFNGSLTYKESENLKTQTAINNAIVSGIYKELKRHNLRAVQYEDSKSPNVFDIKLIHIGLYERLTTWIKSLIKFEIVRKI